MKLLTYLYPIICTKYIYLINKISNLIQWEKTVYKYLSKELNMCKVISLCSPQFEM